MPMRDIFYRGPGNYDVTEASDQAVRELDPESLTVQSMAEDADINVMMRRFGITGKFPENARVPTYGDFTGISDFRSAFDAVRSATEKFMEIPAETRAMFRNDPQLFLEFASDPANVPKLLEMGFGKQEVLRGSSSESVQAPGGDVGAAPQAPAAGAPGVAGAAPGSPGVGAPVGGGPARPGAPARR